jgi:hypothetical protein
MSKNVPRETAARAERGRRAYLKVNIPGVRPIDQDNRRVARSDERSANLNNEARVRIVLRIKGQSSRGICRSIVTINARFQG